MNSFKITFLIILLSYGQKLFSQKFTFSIQYQYSHYESEHSENPDCKIIFLCNNNDDNVMKIITKNDSVQQISIFDSKNLIAYSSVNKFILDSNLITNIAKSDFIKFNYANYTYSSYDKSITTTKIENGSLINVKKIKSNRDGKSYDLYLKTYKHPKFTNTQETVIGLICGKTYSQFDKINNEVILESYFLINGIKTDLYLLDNLQEVNFEISR